MFTRKEALAVSAAVISLALGSSAIAQPNFIQFDPPSSVSSVVNGLNRYGEVTGYYYKDAQFDEQHAFLRASDGEFLEFTNDGTNPSGNAINAHRVVVGSASHTLNEGFIGKDDGSLTWFTALGHDTSGYGTQPQAIDGRGNIVGFYSDDSGAAIAHGFLRHKRGRVTLFDAPNAGTQSNQGTYPKSMNSDGYVAGYTIDQTNVYHGFVRAPDGTMAVIDIDGAGSGAKQGTRVTSLNEKGMTCGFFYDSAGMIHGFLRNMHGHVVKVDVEGAKSTAVRSVNKHGAATGNMVDSSGTAHGFVRSAAGDITIFDSPGGARGTVPIAINDHGDIAGSYIDANGYQHSFLRTP